MTLLVTKDATSNKVHVFSATDEQIRQFDQADFGVSLMGWPIASAEQLANTSLSAQDLVALHNASYPGARLVPSQSKRQIAQAVFDGLAKVAMPYDDKLLKAKKATPVPVAKIEVSDKKQRLSRANEWTAPPIPPIRAAREGSCSANLIDILKDGATLTQMQTIVPNWQPSSILSALQTDINNKNGYGIMKVRVDGDFVYTLLYPAGMTEPLAHITKEKKS